MEDTPTYKYLEVVIADGNMSDVLQKIAPFLPLEIAISEERLVCESTLPNQ